MRKNKIIYSVIALIIISFVSLISLNFYKETYGYPWKHAELKKEAVEYMKKKYNMDVNVAGSSFNNKFDYYIAEVYNVDDEDKNVINVEKHRGERLEDSYSKVYWEKQTNNELQKRYPKFYKLGDIDKITTDIAYFTTPLEIGVSSNKDENGILIPSNPDHNCIVDVHLKTNDFSDEFLQELLLVIKDVVKTQFKVDFVITGKNEGSGNGNNPGRTRILNLEYKKFKDISDVEALKKEISEF